MENFSYSSDYTHIPVFYREVASLASSLDGVGKNIFIDCTLGEGGHSEMLLERFAFLKLIAFERDPEILSIAQKRLERFAGRIEFINDNFCSIDKHLAPYCGAITGFLYDFGISSFHFDKSGRGFTFQNDEPLDMRLDPSCAHDAACIVNTFSEQEISRIIYVYGEERFANRIARVIVDARQKKNIETVSELAALVLKAIPAKFRVHNIHPATRVFQALRIAVNDELSAIETSLAAACGLLAPCGKIAAISFHSLEDRIVKNTFRAFAGYCTCGKPVDLCTCSRIKTVEIETRKPVVPLDDETAANRRARSAKLRICSKIGADR